MTATVVIRRQRADASCYGETEFAETRPLFLLARFWDGFLSGTYEGKILKIKKKQIEFSSGISEGKKILFRVDP